MSGKTFGKEHNVRLFTDRWPNATTVILTFNEGTAKRKRIQNYYQFTKMWQLYLLVYYTCSLHSGHVYYSYTVGVFTFSVDAAIAVSTLKTPGIINDKEVATIGGNHDKKSSKYSSKL